MVSSFFWDAMERVMHVQFTLVQQEDVAVTFTEPTSGRARHELARLPGVAVVADRVYDAVARRRHRLGAADRSCDLR